MRTTTYLTICLFSLLLFSACSKSEKSPADNKYNQALKLQEAEQYKDALRLFHKTVQIDPNYEEAYLQIASIYDDHLEDKDRAVEWYQKYLDISKNEKQKELVKKWLNDAKIAAMEIKQGAKGDLARLSPQVRNIINQHISFERAKIKNEYKAKEKNVSAKYKKEIQTLKEQLATYKAENAEIKDKLESANIDLQAAQKNSARTDVRNKLASLLSSSNNDDGKAGVSAQQFVNLKSKFEEQKVQLSQELAKNAQLSRQIVSLNDSIRSLKQLQKASNKSKVYQKQIDELQEQNTKLAEKVKLLENAAATASVASENSEEIENEIRALQNRVTALNDEKNQILAEKHQAEQTLAQLQERFDKFVANSSNKDLAKKAIDENKKLRLQIAQITTKFNDINEKLNSAEQKNQELQTQLDELKDMPQAAQAVASSDNFKDLSEEIVAMQQTIRQQKDIIKKKDVQLSELINQNLNLQKSVESKTNDNLVRELNAQLVQKNSQIQDLTAQLGKTTRDLEAASIESKRVKSLSKQIADLRAQLNGKNQSMDSNVAQYQKYKLAYDSLVSRFNAVNAENKQLEIQINNLKSQLASNKKTKFSYTKTKSTYRPKYSSSKKPFAVGKTSKRKYSSITKSNTYRVRRGDTLRKISQKVYGDPNKWNVIYANNRDILPRITSLREGQVLYIPPINR